MNEIAGCNTEAGENAGLAPAMHGARQNQQHGRTRNQEEPEHDGNESPQRGQVKHVVSLLASVGALAVGQSSRFSASLWSAKHLLQSHAKLSMRWI
jgi:hypothetical protein